MGGWLTDQILTICAILDAMKGLADNMYEAESLASKNWRPIKHQMHVLYMHLGRRIDDLDEKHLPQKGSN
jgi:hypothetical protein